MDKIVAQSYCRFASRELSAHFGNSAHIPLRDVNIAFIHVHGKLPL
jgi:hypothetical protein